MSSAFTGSSSHILWEWSCAESAAALPARAEVTKLWRSCGSCELSYEDPTRHTQSQSQAVGWVGGPPNHPVIRTMKATYVSARIQAADDATLKQIVTTRAAEKYNQEPMPLQVECVSNLTGFGKSRVSEIYVDLLTKDRHGKVKGVAVVLNPLVGLGDNEVEEKLAAGSTAMNLTQANFTDQAALDVEVARYNFVYVSPKIFLNNLSFRNIYFSTDFQAKLSLLFFD
ncbi:hypothetical protein VP01_305g1 [Puccinia sorghi]|uniref:Uncharacterized protein n=1 Tax=Puccinia sorghi TaxID=27349 RepID=A0A0L6UZU0_9BASI|nr:hypothetical protein VP01_305g1 [Puccinia sorghi]